jgi:probable F420-dependent oxidoreductase
MSDSTFGEYGIWRRRPDLVPGFASEVERLGFGTLWIGGSPGEDLASLEQALSETSRLVVASSVVNIWNAGAEPTAATFRRLDETYPGRVFLGIGSGHREATPQRTKPLDAYRDYLDVLDASGVPKDKRLLAALGDRALEIARDRTRGSIPYFTTPEHTRHARGILGPDALLAVEQGVTVTTDVDEARAIARRAVRDSYLKMVNYVSTLHRFGFDESDTTDGGSDRLIDTMVRHGSASEIAASLADHREAGADHVAIQVLADGADVRGPMAALAEELALAS